MFDWGDLRFALAAARNGSALAAARELNVSHPTVTRRIDALERSLGVQVFERSQSGLRLTERGAALLVDAERVEASVRDLLDNLAAQQRTVSATVRITTVLIAAERLVTPAAAAFRRRHPEVRIEIIATDERINLSHGAADIAYRFGSGPTQQAEIARRMPDVAMAPYCSVDYLEQREPPASVADLGRHALIGCDGELADLPAWKWLRAQAPHADVVTRANSLMGVAAAARAGLGIAMLPCAFADGDRRLVQVLPPVPELAANSWLITHERVRDLPHVRAFIDFFAGYINTRAHEFAGRT
jgi:DNA-binding transcriptional LysR family regulator